jgi:hypothetical protein
VKVPRHYSDNPRCSNTKFLCQLAGVPLPFINWVALNVVVETQHVHRALEIDVQQRFRGDELVHPTILVEAVEAALLEIEQGQAQGVRGRLAGSPARAFFALRRDFRNRHPQPVQYVEFPALARRQPSSANRPSLSAIISSCTGKPLSLAPGK